MSTPTDTKPEETPEPIEEAGPALVRTRSPTSTARCTSAHPVKHGVSPNCGDPCYQVVKP